LSPFLSLFFSARWQSFLVFFIGIGKEAALLLLYNTTTPTAAATAAAAVAAALCFAHTQYKA
jgi:hypothetical protein